MALRADLVGRLGREVGPAGGLADLVDPVAQRRVERLEHRHPQTLAPGDLVELLLHPGREREVDVVAEVLDEEVRHDLADQLGMEAPLLDPDVAPVEDRRDRRGVGRRPADPVLLERLDQRRLGEARRRLREVLGRRHVADGRDRALAPGPAGCARPRRRRRRRGLPCRPRRSRRRASSSRSPGARTGRRRARSWSSRAPWPPSATRAPAARSGGRGAARPRRGDRPASPDRAGTTSAGSTRGPPGRPSSSSCRPGPSASCTARRSGRGSRPAPRPSPRRRSRSSPSACR